MKTLVDILKNGKLRFPGAPALKIKPRYRSIVWNYSQLSNFASGIAKLLEEKRIKKGDRVLLWAPNSPYWLGSFFGCLLKGVVAVPLHLQNTHQFIREIERQTKAKLLLKYSGLKAPKGLQCPSLDIDYLDEFIEREHKFLAPSIKESDIAEILYTSGTTGDPKGVILTHKNIIFNLKAIFHIIDVKKTDRILSILPLSHIFEQIVEFRILASGAQIVYIPALSSVVITRNLRENKITKMAVVPEFLRLVMERIESEAKLQGKEKILQTLFKISPSLPIKLRRILFQNVHQKFGGKLGLIISGGAPLDLEVAKKWKALGIDIVQGYGLTETSPIVSALTEKDKKLASIGKIIQGIEVKIAKDGEILVKGPIVTQGYWKNPLKTKEAFKAGWFKTGDIGYFDKEGYLYLKGRKKFMILTPAGQNVYPEDLEAELNKEEEIEDSCVIGLKKEGRLLIHAVLLSKVKKIELQKIIDRVNKRLASFQQIQSWSIWSFSDFPRTITRKVKRPEVSQYLVKQIVPAEVKVLRKEIPLLINILAQITETNPSLISQQSSIVKNLKLDSLMRIELVGRIEEEFGVEIDEASITSETKVADLEKLIQEKPKKLLKYKLRTWPRLALINGIRQILQNLIFFPIILNLLSKIEVEGMENIKKVRTPIILMPNHISDLDTPIIFKVLPSVIQKKLTVAAATDILYEKLWYVQPLVTLFFNTYPLPRTGQIKSGLIYTGELLDKGWSILVFPEGGISETGKLLPLKMGTGVMGLEMQVPIIPVKIIGTQEILPIHWQRRGVKKLRGKVIVKIGKPIYFKKGAAYDAATKVIEKAMRTL